MTQALFANQLETNLTSTTALIEEVLQELGHDPGKARQSEMSSPSALHAWRVTKGSAVTDITVVNRTQFAHLRVCSVVMTVDDSVDRVALNQHLLELNATLCGAAFAVDADHVLLLSERSTLDLDSSEVRELIKRVTTYADDHDDALVARFGGKMGEAD